MTIEERLRARGADPALLAEVLPELRAYESLSGLRDYMEPSGHPDFLYPYAKHHKLMADAFERVLRGELKRLYIALPPGSAKSTLLRQFKVAFALRNPGVPILRTSATQVLAERQARILRSAFQEPLFMELSGTSLLSDHQGAASFGLDSGTTVTSAGIGSSIVGLRAGLGVIDDPVAGFEEARSETARQKAYDWYVAEFVSRLLPGAPLVMVATRWHRFDLPGMILDADGERWEVIRIPLECEDENDPLGRDIGEMMWPEWFREDMFIEAKRDPETWAGLYQQRPFVDKGDFLSADDIEIVDQIPENLGIYASMDLALSEKQSADATVITIAGVCNEGYLWILYVHQERVSPEKSLGNVVELYDRHKFREILIEDSPAEKVFMDLAHKYLRSKGKPVPFHPMPTRGKDKVARAQAFRGLAKMGAVKMLRGPWNNAVLREVTEFPSPKEHDDIIDTLALLARRAAKMSGSMPVATQEKQVTIEGNLQIVEGRAHTRSTLNDLWADNKPTRRRTIRI